MVGSVPHSGKFVPYYRVSTKRQGHSGLGLEAQKEIIIRHLDGGDWELLEAFTEMESGKRSDRKRVQLRKAIDLCLKEDATLVVANISRLTRNVPFLSRIIERNVKFIACDVPELGNPAQNRFLLQLMANVAELEASQISERTKIALQAKKARLGKGERLGNPNPNAGAVQGAGEQVATDADEFALEVGPIIKELEKFGCDTLAKKKEGLEARGIKTARENTVWSLSAIRNVQMRYTLIKEREKECQTSQN